MWPLVPLLVGAPGPFEPNISSAPNLNGEYVLSPTPHGPHAQAKFPTHYKDYPGGAEYFTVYSPPISTLYSQVFWKGLDPVPLPDEVVKRYAGRGMAVIGFEMDQVIRGAKGDGSDDIQIPITQAYNHHFESTMTGVKSRMRKVRFTGPDDPRLAALKARHHGHRLPREDEAWVVDELAEGTGGIPTHQAFGGANGGEYRKSFHGYAPGYAQVIDSPEAIQITPMQIDTWQRDAMPRAGQPGAAKFVPGPVPRASLAPTSGPDAIYSGLLECPKTTRVHADLDNEYSRTPRAAGAAATASARADWQRVGVLRRGGPARRRQLHAGGRRHRRRGRRAARSPPTAPARARRPSIAPAGRPPPPAAPEARPRPSRAGDRTLWT